MKVIILGNSIAAARFIEEIKTINPQSEIILFPFGEDRVVPRNEFMALLAQQKPLLALYDQDADFYQKHGVRLITEDKPERINFSRRQLTTASKEKLTFDYLIIDETGQNQLPPVRGIQKTGVFAFRRLCDVNEILIHLPVTETVAVVSDTLWGFKTACALRRKEKEVILITSCARLLEDSFDEETTQCISDNLETWGIRLSLSQQITELLGDSDLKAVRFSNGKVISCQMVVFPDAGPDFKLFKDTGLEYKDSIIVNGGFQTNIDNVFAINRSVSFRPEIHEQYRALVRQQGAILAACVAGEKRDFAAPVAEGALALENFDFQFVGRCVIAGGTQVLSRRDESRNAFLKIMLENQVPVGALFINWQTECQRIKDMILHSRGNLESLEIFQSGHMETPQARPDSDIPIPQVQPVLTADTDLKELEIPSGTLTPQGQERLS